MTPEQKERTPEEIVEGENKKLRGFIRQEDLERKPSHGKSSQKAWGIPKKCPDCGLPINPKKNEGRVKIVDMTCPQFKTRMVPCIGCPCGWYPTRKRPLRRNREE